MDVARTGVVPYSAVDGDSAGKLGVSNVLAIGVQLGELLNLLGVIGELAQIRLFAGGRSLTDGVETQRDDRLVVATLLGNSQKRIGGSDLIGVAGHSSGSQRQIDTL